MSDLPIPAFFIGCVQSSAVALQALLTRPELSMRGVLTLRKSGFNADFTDLTGIANQAGVPVHFAEETDNTALADLLHAQAIEIVFTIGWSRLLNAEVLKIPSLGVIGYHPAALPLNRGRHPLIWALALGLEETASTFFLMDEGADSGPVLDQKPLPITSQDDAGTLYAKALSVIPAQLDDIVLRLAAGRLDPQIQDHAKATYWRKRGASDGLIDWRMPADGIHNLVRALTHPYIGADFHAGDALVKLWRCEVGHTDVPRNAEPGKVLWADGATAIVKAGTNAIRLLECDPPPELREGDYL